MSKLRTLGGAAAELVELSGERVVVDCETSAPPGSTLVLQLEADPEPYAVKISGCRLSAGVYRLQGRLVNVSRERRARLATVKAT